METGIKAEDRAKFELVVRGLDSHIQILKNKLDGLETERKRFIEKCQKEAEAIGVEIKQSEDAKREIQVRLKLVEPSPPTTRPYEFINDETPKKIVGPRVRGPTVKVGSCRIPMAWVNGVREFITGTKWYTSIEIRAHMATLFPHNAPGGVELYVGKALTHLKISVPQFQHDGQPGVQGTKYRILKHNGERDPGILVLTEGVDTAREEERRREAFEEARKAGLIR